MKLLFRIILANGRHHLEQSRVSVPAEATYCLQAGLHVSMMEEETE